MRTATIVLACAAAAALVTVDHVAAIGPAAAGKGDRLIPHDQTLRSRQDAIAIQTGDNATIAIRKRGPDQMVRELARPPAARPPATQPAKSSKRLPHACEPSVSPLASNTTFGARCVT